MPLLQNELARWKNGQLELRPEPLRVRWAFDDLVTSDGHALRCGFSCSVRGLPDPTERRMLQEVLLQGRTSVTERELTEHFSRTLKPAAQKVAEAQTVTGLLAEDGRRPLVEALRTAAGPVAFACGVELLPPFQVDVESPTLQQQRQRTMHRAMAEQTTAAQIEHMQRARELFKQFQEMRQAEPGLSAGQVLQQISPSDRGSVLQKLLLASASGGVGAPPDLLAVAGPHLVRIDRAEGAYRPELTSLPETLGPLRSAQSADVDGRRMLLIGAQGGFLLVPAGESGEVVAYADPGLESPLGFNRVIYWAGQRCFVGCHGEGGLVIWDAGSPAAPRTAIRPRDLHGPGASAATTSSGSATGGDASTSSRVPGPRNLQVVDGERLIFSLGSRLSIWDGKGVSALPAESQADVTTVVAEGNRLHIVHEDGTLCGLDRATLETTCKERRAGRVRAAGALPWLGEVRLLLAGEDGPVYCVGFDDQLVTHYASSHQSLRVVAGSADLVAAVSADRQRLVLWNSWDGRKPAAELHLGGVARHRVADIAFA